MSDGYGEARQRRNFLERLGEKIPGYRGFQDRELRRDVDKLQREHIASRLHGLQDEVRGKAERFVDAGQLGVMQPFDRLDKRLDGLARTIRHSDYGASGLFDVVKVGEAELERLYALDLSVMEDLESLAAAVAAVPEPSADPGPALAAALERLGQLEEKWKSRRNVIGDVVRT